jgi:hypothetical protein
MLDKRLRRRVERAFYEYKQNKELGAEAIVELAERGLTAKYGAVGGGNCTGNPTESKAIKATEGSNAAMWCYVVELTQSHFAGTGKDTLIKLRYFDKLSERRVCDKLYIERSAYYDWLADVLTHAAMLALQFGLLKII